MTSLNCRSNQQLASLDVSKNTALTELKSSYTQLTSLDVSACTKLTELECEHTQLTSLDVSKNTVLRYLWCHSNQLTSLDVLECTHLSWLDCSDNQLTSLDIPKDTALIKLECYENQLTVLDVSGCTKLESLYCYVNQIKGASMDNLINSLPIHYEYPWGEFLAYSPLSSDEGNVCTTEQVMVAKERGWRVYYRHDEYGWQEYEGSDDTSSVTNDIRTETYKNAPVYNLRGQRLTAPQKGINIIGGRKVIMK